MEYSILGKIVSYRPFIAKSIYENSDFEYRFRCPRCGSHNAKKLLILTVHGFLKGTISVLIAV